MCIHPLTPCLVGNIYKSTTCAVYDTYTQNSNVTYCASSRFYCEFGTKNIAQYDDPFTGWAYNCTADAVTENCSGDNVVRCVSEQHPPPPAMPERPIQLSQESAEEV